MYLVTDVQAVRITRSRSHIWR